MSTWMCRRRQVLEAGRRQGAAVSAEGAAVSAEGAAVSMEGEAPAPGGQAPAGPPPTAPEGVDPVDADVPVAADRASGRSPVDPTRVPGTGGGPGATFPRCPAASPGPAAGAGVAAGGHDGERVPGSGASSGARGGPGGPSRSRSLPSRHEAGPRRTADGLGMAKGAAEPGGSGPSGGVAAAAGRLRFWAERDSPEDDEERDMVRAIRRRVFEETESLSPRERDDCARRIATEMAGRLSRVRQERVVAEVLGTLGGRLGPLEPLMRDAGVSEVLVNAPDEVWVDRRGTLERLPLRFRGDREVRALVEGVCAWEGRKFDWASPIVDCPLPDGSRLAAVRWPVARRGTAVAIRRFPVMPAFADLRRWGSLPARDGAAPPGFLDREPFPGEADVADFLAWAFRRRASLVVSGSTSSGKTTFLNAAMELISPRHRVVIIEDTAELQPPADLHVVRLERRSANIEGEGEVGLKALLVASLRLRPDIIVVGECRKNETSVMLEAMSTGHDGSLTTVHANSPLDALERMIRMIREDYPATPTAELRRYAASAIQLVVQFRRDETSRGGLRVVERVASVDGVDDGGAFRVSDLYRWRGGRFVPTGAVPAWASPDGGVA